MANKTVLDYLVATNRPYSSTDITSNLHKEYGKAAIQKALDQLTEEGKIREKTYGKQKVYCIIPEDKNLSNEEEAREMEVINAEIMRLSTILKTSERETKMSEIELQSLLSQPTNDEAKPKIRQIEEQNSQLRAKIKTLSETWKDANVEDRHKIKDERTKIVKEYRKRKRLCMDILNAIMEGYQGSKESLMEEIGIETDEDVSMAPLN